MFVYEYVVRPLTYAACIGDAERVHDLSMFLLRQPWVASCIRAMVPIIHDSRLQQEVYGVLYDNPVGLAAGLDKNGVALPALDAFGFGALTVGGVTPRPQKGNPKPRMCNVQKDRALINRMGLNGVGCSQVREHIRPGASSSRQAVLGVNIAVNAEHVHDPQAAIGDFEAVLSCLYSHMAYGEVNISSPNTVGLRDLVAHLECILHRLVQRRSILASVCNLPIKPLYIKLSPDTSFALLQEIVAVAARYDMIGLILVNTTVSRGGLRTSRVPLQGGLSGRPLYGRAVERVRFARECHQTIPIIGVGGISNARDAIEMLMVGANLLQVFTAFVVEDPYIVYHINKGILAYMEREEMSQVSDFRRAWR